jgi:hypothetical protein
MRMSDTKELLDGKRDLMIQTTQVYQKRTSTVEDTASSIMYWSGLSLSRDLIFVH